MKRRAFLESSLAAGIAGPTWGQAPPPLYLTPKDPEYGIARQPFNTCIALRPAVIARCRTEKDVQEAVQYAQRNQLKVSVKSGGHSFTGFSLNDGGLTLDLSDLRLSVLEKESHLYTAGPGWKLGEIYDKLLPAGRLLPAGSCSGVGLAGLTLGGGYGLFARQFGLTCDHLTRIRMVNGLGKIIDSNDNPDLLWACRGGGNGNFGVVTSMTFRTQPAPKRLTAQRFLSTKLSQKKMADWIRIWFEMADQLPNPIFSALVLNGSQVSIMLTSTHPSNGPSFQRAAAKLKTAGARTKGASSRPLSAGIKRFYGRPDPLPFHNVSGGYYSGYSSVASSCKEIARTVQKNPGLIYQINTLGGAITDGPDSAYPHRNLPYLGEIQSYWQRESQRESLTQAVVALRKHLSESGVTTQYRNYPDLSLANWESAYYGSAYPKLQEIKALHDPNDLFHHPQSVRLPAS